MKFKMYKRLITSLCKQCQIHLCCLHILKLIISFERRAAGSRSLIGSQNFMRDNKLGTDDWVHYQIHWQYRFKMYKHNFSPWMRTLISQSSVIVPLWSVEFHRGAADVTRPLRACLRLGSKAFLSAIEEWTEALMASSFRHLILLSKDTVPQFGLFRLNVTSNVTWLKPRLPFEL